MYTYRETANITIAIIILWSSLYKFHSSYSLCIFFVFCLYSLFDLLSFIIFTLTFFLLFLFDFISSLFFFSYVIRILFRFGSHTEFLNLLSLSAFIVFSIVFFSLFHFAFFTFTIQIDDNKASSYSINCQSVKMSFTQILLILIRCHFFENEILEESHTKITLSPSLIFVSWKIS